MKWKDEKEYASRREMVLKREMIAATRECDKAAFAIAYSAAQRYMKRKELRDMMLMFVSHMAN